jgi:shikimate dehydrogenase
MLFTIFGDPVSHSKSPQMHNYTFKKLGIDACYTRTHLKDGERLKTTFLALKLQGANITVPHKEAAFKACDILDDFARKVGAVNTIVRKNDKLYGYNTDAPGFLKAIEPFNARRVLFLGAGGTAKSTAVILREAGYEVTVLNRSEGRLEYFKRHGFNTATYDSFEPSEAYELIVNMTSAGLKDDALPAPASLIDALFAEARGAVDVIYGKRTPFLQRAEAAGLRIADGAEMLLQQGIIAFLHFTDHRFTHEEVEPIMREGLRL